MYLTQVSEASRNGSEKDDNKNQDTDTESSTANKNHKSDDIQSYTDKKRRYSNYPDSEYTKIFVDTDSIFINKNPSTKLARSMNTLNFWSTKDRLYIWIMCLGIFVLIVQGKWRRKTSRQLRNFFSRLKNPFK
ncbi:hypothetical protein RF11_03087 [Thelohanellus kitauei]|uniref:Uncharacterized protein n=1 Tax=Thelohanellus kitauei TaxID=669202 RepID=A0A0C2JK28_THEKT|nr:hypothetical protein RF11_03087 [Thelohanellus kitauei]